MKVVGRRESCYSKTAPPWMCSESSEQPMAASLQLPLLIFKAFEIFTKLIASETKHLLIHELLKPQFLLSRDSGPVCMETHQRLGWGSSGVPRPCSVGFEGYLL